MRLNRSVSIEIPIEIPIEILHWNGSLTQSSDNQRYYQYFKILNENMVYR